MIHFPHQDLGLLIIPYGGHAVGSEQQLLMANRLIFRGHECCMSCTLHVRSVAHTRLLMGGCLSMKYGHCRRVIVIITRFLATGENVEKFLDTANQAPQIV